MTEMQNFFVHVMQMFWLYLFCSLVLMMRGLVKWTVCEKTM